MAEHHLFGKAGGQYMFALIDDHIKYETDWCESSDRNGKTYHNI
jgi:hypothetical protein